ncbi:MAG: helix-turn-helix domain-containing protein [Actinomycetota bacterium]|nr:helix-turn-helix domain-containing protein [Actinomycetota bacterium]
MDRAQTTRTTVYNWLRSGELPSAKLGKLRRIRESDWDRFVAEHLEQVSQ